MKNKLKVLWFCYFTNAYIQDIIKPYKRLDEFAPWITNLIPLFENDEAIELHIVSPHEWISGYKHFERHGVFYHFFNKDIPFIGRHWPGFFRFDIWTDYFMVKTRIARLVKKIQPDIIHMHGAENHFCTGITQFQNKYPVFITIQGFIHKSSAHANCKTRRASKEIEILKMFNHFGYRTKTMGEDLKALNPTAVLHWHNYARKAIQPINVEKKYDLVFFSRLAKEKGIEDLLKVVSLINKFKPDISLCVIGAGKIEHLKLLAEDLNIQNNVYWAGFLSTQEDVHKLASQARLCILPTYDDIIPGTIVESLFLKVPVIAYNVGSIHELNLHEEVVCLVEKSDLNGLVYTISKLLNDEEMRNEFAEKGYQRIQEFCITVTDDNVRADLLKAYNEVIQDFNKCN